MIKYVRNEASLAKKIHYLNYDIEKNKCFVTFDDENSKKREDLSSLGRSITLPRSVHFKDINTPREGTVTEGVPYTVFSPKGLVEMTVIHLESKRGEQRTLIIKPLMGGVRVYDRYLEIQREGIHAF